MKETMQQFVLDSSYISSAMIFVFCCGIILESLNIIQIHKQGTLNMANNYYTDSKAQLYGAMH